MNCPKCAASLTKKFYKGMMEVDYCPNCRGMWLDFNELDRQPRLVDQSQAGVDAADPMDSLHVVHF